MVLEQKGSRDYRTYNVEDIVLVNLNIYSNFTFCCCIYTAQTFIFFLISNECVLGMTPLGKPGTIRESNQASGVHKAHYA